MCTKNILLHPQLILSIASIFFSVNVADPQETPDKYGSLHKECGFISIRGLGGQTRKMEPGEVTVGRFWSCSGSVLGALIRVGL